MGVDDEAVEKQQQGTQCEKLKNFLSLIFYVKSIFENLGVVKLPFLPL